MNADPVCALYVHWQADRIIAALGVQDAADLTELVSLFFE